MDLLRATARPMLASMFVYGGLDSLRHAEAKVPAAEGVAQQAADALPLPLPDRTVQLVKLNGAVQVGAGALLAMGKLPRVAALALAATLVPTTLAGHRFWEAEDEPAHGQQVIHFLKNVAMFGGLLIAAADTGGRPSIPWQAQRASERALARAGEAWPGS